MADIKTDRCPLPPLEPRAGLTTLLDLNTFAAEATRVGARVHRCEPPQLRQTLLQALRQVPDQASIQFESRELLRSGGWDIGSQKFCGVRAVDLRADGPITTREFDVADVAAGVTGVDFGLADTGTLVLRSSSQRGRLLSLLPPIHVAILEAKRILPDLASFLAQARTDCSAVTFITGPSKTADIEQTLAIGVHGPGELHILVVD